MPSVHFVNVTQHNLPYIHFSGLIQRFSIIAQEKAIVLKKIFNQKASSRI